MGLQQPPSMDLDTSSMISSCPSSPVHNVQPFAVGGLYYTAGKNMINGCGIKVSSGELDRALKIIVAQLTSNQIFDPISNVRFKSNFEKLCNE